jgi:hypothetical protein
MYPTIRDGETVVVRPIDPKLVRRGDVLLYCSPRGLTAHRVVGVVGEIGAPAMVVFRGESAGALDERIDSRHILGRVVHVERGAWRLDPASSRARLVSRAWRAIAQIKGQVRKLVAGSRLPKPHSATGRTTPAREGHNDSQS